MDKLIEQFPLKKPSILKHMRAALDAVLEKASFNVGRTPILHRAILAYLTVADKSVFKDMIELLKDHLVHMLHTREGAKVTQLCLLHGSPKDRKNIVKTFKTFVQAISKEQYGHAVLITCFECIDDTVLISKVILAELFSEHVGQLLRDVYGSRVVLYLLKGRDKRYQPQYMIQELEAMDRIRAETTKKTHDARWQQNLDAAIPTLSPHVAHYGGELMRSKQGSTVLIETCKVAGNGTEKILDSIIADISASETSSFKPHEPINVIKKMKKARDVARKLEQGIDYAEPLLSNRFSTLALKTLLVPCKGEPDSEWKVSFREKMWNVINPRYCELLELCSSNPVGTAGLAFILVALYENGTDTIKKQMKTDSKSIKKSLIDKVKNHPLPENELKRKHENQTGIEILLSQL